MLHFVFFLLWKVDCCKEKQSWLEKLCFHSYVGHVVTHNGIRKVTTGRELLSNVTPYL